MPIVNVIAQTQCRVIEFIHKHYCDRMIIIVLGKYENNCLFTSANQDKPFSSRAPLYLISNPIKIFLYIYSI